MKTKTTKVVKSCQKNSTTLSQAAVLQIARSRIEQFLPLKADGYACTTEQLVDVLLAVCCQKETLEQVCSDLKIKVGAETLRGYFNQQLQVGNLSGLQEAVHLALQASLQAELKEQKLDVAIDFHDQSYYGKSAPSEGQWVGAEAKNGTTKVSWVATLYVIKNGHWLTLAIKFVLPGETAKESVEYLLNQMKSLEIAAKCLYLDRGFGGIEIARYLKETGQKAIIACPIRGKTGGLRGWLCVGRKNYRTKHLFQSAKHGAEEVAMVLFKAFTTSTKKGQKVRQVKWLALYVGQLRREFECQESERKLPQKVWH